MKLSNLLGSICLITGLALATSTAEAASTVTVVCPGDSIQAALDKEAMKALPARKLDFEVTGTCTETVSVILDDVILRGIGVSPTLVGRFTITGASRVFIKDLTIRDSNGTGVLVTDGAFVNMEDLIISGHDDAGIGVLNNSFARMTRVNVNNPPTGFNALFLQESGSARVRDSTFVSQNGVFDDGAAIGLFRSAQVRLEGDNTIRNTNVDPFEPNKALAIQVLHTSELRLQRGSNQVDGNVFVSSNSNADFRDNFTVTGLMGIAQQSRGRMRGGQMNGNVLLTADSLFAALGGPPPTNVNGDIICSGTNFQNLVDASNLVVTGVISPTCTIE